MSRLGRVMIFAAIFLLELISLFFISGLLTRLLSQFLLRITKSSSTTIQLLSFLFLPGVIVHELSHILVAGILFVKTGEVEFTPKIIKDSRSEGVKLGSVAIAKTDPVRRVFIGVAPVFVGLGFVLAAAYVMFDKSFIHIFSSQKTIEIIIKVVLFYLLFAVANTMFSSRKDMEGAVGFLAVVFLIILVLYLVGVRIPLEFLTINLPKEFLPFIKQQNVFLLTPLVIDAVIVGTIKIVGG